MEDIQKRSVTFGDLKIDLHTRERILQVLDSNWVSAGPLVEQFEKEWSRVFGYKHSIAVGNGTDACIAMYSTLYDLGAERGDDILCPALTFPATVNAIFAAGFNPVFVDIDRRTLNINPEEAQKRITPRTRALVVVHIMGRPAPMFETVCFCTGNHLHLFEDCCEAHGAMYMNRPVGTFGLAAAFSCYAAHLVVCGEGGVVVTADDCVANTIRSVRSHGRKNGDLYFDFERIGYNLKMNDLEAAIGLGQLESFSTTFERRKHNYSVLLNLLEDLEEKELIVLFREGEGEVISPHAFPLLCLDSQDMRSLYAYLEMNGIQCKTLFGSLPTQHRAYAFMNHRCGEFPEAEYVGDHGFHIGIHQYLTDEDLSYVSAVIHRFFEEVK
jgi:dTDP-4-amino-4,6-dideoxygalactose transaminase